MWSAVVSRYYEAGNIPKMAARLLCRAYKPLANRLLISHRMAGVLKPVHFSMLQTPQKLSRFGPLFTKHRINLSRAFMCDAEKETGMSR